MHTMACILRPLFIVGILTLMPTMAGSGPICLASCLAAIGFDYGYVGRAALATLGFTNSGILAGSWAAAWMATFGGRVPPSSALSLLQSAGAVGTMAIWNVYDLCGTLCDSLP